MSLMDDAQLDELGRQLAECKKLLQAALLELQNNQIDHDLTTIEIVTARWRLEDKIEKLISELE